jgi:hypothetical protein
MDFEYYLIIINRTLITGNRGKVNMLRIKLNLDKVGALFIAAYE